MSVNAQINSKFNFTILLVQFIGLVSCMYTFFAHFVHTKVCFDTYIVGIYVVIELLSVLTPLVISHAENDRI